MLLWLCFALMTAALLGVVLRPFVQRTDAADDVAPDSGLASVYKAQLAELDRDISRGTVGEDEARDMRAEIGRRLLAEAPADREAPAVAHTFPPKNLDRLVVGAAALVVPLVAIGTYLSLGAPSLPGQPHQARVIASAGNARVDELVRRVEQRLVSHPDDGKGWEVLAPVYMKLRRFEDAAEAYRNTVRLLGATADRLFGFGEASVFAANGIVEETARTTFVKVVALEPRHVRARYWLAVAKEQDGDLADARADLAALLPVAGSATAMGQGIAEHIAAIDVRLRDGGQAPDVQSATVPSDQGERAAMIQGMVDGLAARLEDDASDFPGWMRLIRSYVVLGNQTAAKAAMMRARAQFRDAPERLERLRQLGTELGMGS